MLDQLHLKKEELLSLEQSRPSSSSSILSTSEWRKIKGLVKEAIKEADTLKQQKLANTIIHITTMNSLLKSEIEGYKQALYKEKKRRKRGKGLFKELRAVNNNGATFFSPHKI